MGGAQCRRHGATEVEKVVRSDHDCPLLLSDMRMNLRLCHHQAGVEERSSRVWPLYLIKEPSCICIFRILTGEVTPF